MHPPTEVTLSSYPALQSPLPNTKMPLLNASTSCQFPNDSPNKACYCTRTLETWRKKPIWSLSYFILVALLNSTTSPRRTWTVVIYTAPRSVMVWVQDSISTHRGSYCIACFIDPFITKYGKRLPANVVPLLWAKGRSLQLCRCAIDQCCRVKFHPQAVNKVNDKGGDTLQQGHGVKSTKYNFYAILNNFPSSRWYRVCAHWQSISVKTVKPRPST